MTQVQDIDKGKMQTSPIACYQRRVDVLTCTPFGGCSYEAVWIFGVTKHLGCVLLFSLVLSNQIAPVFGRMSLKSLLI